MSELENKMQKWRSEFERQGGTMGMETLIHSMMADYGEQHRENERLRKELEEKEVEIKRTRITSSVHEGNYNAYFKECERLGKELEEARKISFPRQADGEGGWVIDYKFLEHLGVTMLRESDHTIDTEDIELVLLTLEIVLGQEGEGNHEVSK
ncbi:hypothetical protein [Paenibacillus amylolyticus]|uniref:hypothetical protein n=1 Tax=Paenibacillus amylolyticus TaxID=1451 RepID=UPI00096FD39F|nr:hypothetical protein [Paenibacillus amylolyticus]OMF47740.1 hypothetical protein BK136_02275 [Paenibacillus amylolyticus]